MAALTVLAAAAVLFSVRRPGARLLPALLLPGVAAGLALTFGVAFPAAVRAMMGSEPTGWTRRAQ